MTPVSSRPFGEERRHNERSRLILFWSIIAICAVVSTGSLIVAYESKQNADRSEKAHCVLVKFLVGSNIRNAETLRTDPNGSGSDQRRNAVHQTAQLIRELRDTNIHCAPVAGEAQATNSEGTK